MELVKFLLETYGPWALFAVAAWYMWGEHRKSQEQNTEYLQKIIDLLLRMLEDDDPE